MPTTTKTLAVALACAAVSLIAPAAASATFPALRAVVTITGQSSGTESETDHQPPQNSDCPPQDVQENQATQISWRAVFKPVIVPLKKSGFVLKYTPRGTGGLTSGSYTYTGTYLKDDPNNADACPTLTSFSANAKLLRKPFPVPTWDGRSYSPSDLFYVGFIGQPSDIKSSPAGLAIPQGEFGGDPSQLSPIDVASQLPLYDLTVRQSLPLQAQKAGVFVNWNKLQGKVQALRHKSTIRLTVGANLSYPGHGPKPFEEQCTDVGPPSAPDLFGVISCTETMKLAYTITIHKLGPAHGCDVASPRHCLI